MHESKSILSPFVRGTIKIWDPDVQSKPCSLSGTWYNQLGSETILNQKNDGVVEVEYRTAVERRPGSRRCWGSDKLMAQAVFSHSWLFGKGAHP